MTTEQMDWLDDERAGRHDGSASEKRDTYDILRDTRQQIADAMQVPVDAITVSTSTNWGPIPRYAMLDIWMALFGSEYSNDFEAFANEHGYADTWGRLCAGVRGQGGLLLNPDEPAPDLDPEGHFGVAGETWFDGEGADVDTREYAWMGEATMAEEPIEQRLRRAYANGWREGFERGGLDTRWDR